MWAWQAVPCRRRWRNTCRAAAHQRRTSNPIRPLDDITQIIVHQTNTRDDATPERLAGIDTERGLPGPPLSIFLVDGYGVSLLDAAVEAAPPRRRRSSLVNLTGVAVALAGNF